VPRLPHGYTNRTRHREGGIEKRYVGADSLARASRELACLTHLHGRYPVPEVMEFDASVPMIALTIVAGRHGQDLLAAGHAPTVLRLIGQLLANLHAIDPSTVPGLQGDGDVIVHGDFGPQNTLFSLDLTCISGILDWESAHIGSATEDLAWTEWIVRMHHPEAQDDLPELFEGAGLSLRWSDRQSVMVQHCRDFIAYSEASDLDAAAAEWRRRLGMTERWHE
jgi:tRNA A-37 threonylcarbamoyl transferase component Bud32